MKKVFVSVVVIAAFALFGCNNSQEQKNEDAMPVSDTSNGVSVIAHDSLHSELAYICPCGGCPEVKESKPGKCSKCDMDLVEEKK